MPIIRHYSAVPVDEDLDAYLDRVEEELTADLKKSLEEVKPQPPKVKAKGPALKHNKPIKRRRKKMTAKKKGRKKKPGPKPRGYDHRSDEHRANIRKSYNLYGIKFYGGMVRGGNMITQWWRTNTTYVTEEARDTAMKRAKKRRPDREYMGFERRNPQYKGASREQ
jgi:hypothetical protein